MENDLLQKWAFSLTNHQYSYFGPQSKLQWQIAEGGIGSFLQSAKQVAVADSRGRHWLPKREGAHEVGRTASGYLLLQHPS